MEKVLKIVNNVDMVYLCISQYIYGDMISLKIGEFESIAKGIGIKPLLPLFSFLFYKMTLASTSHI